MTALDWVIVAMTALFAVSGYRRGLIVAALSLAGFAAGMFLGTKVSEELLSGGSSSPYAAVFGLTGALLGGGIVAAGFEGFGLRVRRALPPGPIGVLDGLGGAAFSAAVALGIAWVVGTVALAVPSAGGWRQTIERSAILHRLDEILPPSRVLLGALTHFDPLPEIGGLTASVPPPSSAIVDAPAVRLAGESVLRVVGTACGLGIEGSGWVIAPGEVLTNAHVVAGETDTTVEVDGSSPGLPATVVMFDPHNDLALLRVSGLQLPVLPLASSPASGLSAAILGYPENGPFVAEPGRIGATEIVSSEDAYGNGPVERELTAIRGLVRPGNSGGPVVDAAGQVVTTVFAASTSGGPKGGFGVANAVVVDDLAKATGPVSTEGCAG